MERGLPRLTITAASSSAVISLNNIERLLIFALQIIDINLLIQEINLLILAVGIH
jgi:hypothetical protein